MLIITANVHKVRFTNMKRYTVVDGLAGLGSQFSGLFIICNVLVRFFSRNLLLAQLINRLYWFAPKFKEEEKKRRPR
jgi:hypothetical protein